MPVDCVIFLVASFLSFEQADEMKKASIYYREKVFEYPAVGEARRMHIQSFSTTKHF